MGLLRDCEFSRMFVSSSEFNSLPCRGNKTDARPLLTQKQFTEISDHELGAPNKIYRGLHPSGTSGGPRTVEMLTQLQVSTDHITSHCIGKEGCEGRPCLPVRSQLGEN